jgi:hypothetical protein
MTARRTATGLALLIGATLVVAACGSSATATPGGSATPATEVPPTSGLPGFSFALPSFTADAELEALFPDEIGGETVTVRSMSGSDFLRLGTSSKDLEVALQQLGKTPNDLSVGFGGTSSVTIFAFRIKGVPADQFLAAYLAATTQGSTVTDASYGGKSVKKVVTNGQVAAYLYLSGDVLWTVAGAALTDLLLNETFSKLP